MLLEEEASKLFFTLRFLKMKFFSSLLLKNFSSHLTWKLSQVIAFSQMVSIISMNVNKTKLPATKGFTIVHCRLWNMVHGSNINIEIGVYVDFPWIEFLRTISKSRRRKTFSLSLVFAIRNFKFSLLRFFLQDFRILIIINGVFVVCMLVSYHLIVVSYSNS